jgi:hypothetical protein
MMKKSIFFVILVFGGLIFSCSENNSVAPALAKVEKVALDGISAQDILTFQYKNGNVTSVDWCLYIGGLASGCVVGYSEIRHYNAAEKLDSISGRWNISYEYENGVRKKMIAYYNDAYYNTTTFMEYSGANPVKLHVVSPTSGIRYVYLDYNTSGDLTRKTIKDNQGVTLEDVQIQYAAIENPLHGLMETPSYAVEFFGFDTFAFYFSTHVPQIVTITRTNSPVVPASETINYTYQQNDAGQLVSASAFRDQTINLHNIAIVYDN